MRSNISTLKLKAGREEYPTKDYCVGTLIKVDDTGRPVVDFHNNENGPLIARTLVQIPLQSEYPDKHSQSVLLIFEKGDPRSPIIAGFVHETLYSKNDEISFPLHHSDPKELIVDKKRISFNAYDEVVIRCGKSSLNLHKNGKVVMKGVQITTRASQANKIRGANVNIN